AIGLEEEEKNALLLTGGYLPTEEEIEKIRSETNEILEKWPYPAAVIDFSWRAINQNKHHAKVMNISLEEEIIIYKQRLRILELLFNEKDYRNKSLNNEEMENKRLFLKAVLS